MASKKRTQKLARLADVAAVLATNQADVFNSFTAIFADVRERRDNLVTPEVFKAYADVYRVNAWLAVEGCKSANDMWRHLLNLPADTPNTDPRVVAEKNFSDYVRLRSPIALATAGKAKRKQGKRKADTVQDVAEYLKATLPRLKPGKVDGKVVADIYATVRKWAELFATAGQEQEQSKAA